MTQPWQCPLCASGDFPAPRWAPGPLKELDAGSVVDLLGDLDARLAARSARVSLYVVGGSALLLAHGRSVATPDVDVARSVVAADQVAREIAVERGLSMTWLNSSAGSWVPPRPECACAGPAREGLTVHIAPARHLLAMKLVAWRPKDEDDLADLLVACDLADASADEVADVLYEVYTAEDSLAGLLNVGRSDPDETRREAVSRAADALALF
ncbi:MAG TPA: hypothetical protein VMF51_16030 [Nocardioides sp.]|uniref:hypothetical protein n=1 Tax=Nocardioides sp. TaxID=35761 RepID=UPI002CFC762D|nr:hypothetical protein [Nocardioides sp.]HTW16644.1 hypothetical protein [Nocardioides sp.]